MSRGKVMCILPRLDGNGPGRTQQHKGLEERAETLVFDPFAPMYTERSQGPVWKETIMLGWTQSSILGHHLVPCPNSTKSTFNACQKHHYGGPTLGCLLIL